MSQAPSASPRYLSAIDWLYGFADYERQPGVHEFNLDRPRQLLRRLGDPQRAFRSLVVAGTKGKGSTAVMLQALLQAAGHSVGLYTQPHLHDYRERIRVDGQLIGEDELAEGVERMKPAVETLHQQFPELGRLTTYEIGTALALNHFAVRQVEWAVLEVGLGGRLDAVNAVESVQAVLTPISLDHTDILGDSVEQIAREKAGIVHVGGSVVSAPQPSGARQVIEQTCTAVGARLRFVELASIRDLRLHRFAPGASLDEMRSVPWMHLSVGPYDDLELRLGGRHQALNAAVALAAIEQCDIDLTAEQVRAAFASVQWPGRLEAVAERPTTLVDGAHNGASAQALAQAVRDHVPYRRLHLVVGASADKDVGAILEPLVALASQVTATRASHPRARLAEDVAQHAGRLGAATSIAASVAEGIDTARGDADLNDLVLVTGSLFVVAEARAHLGWALPVR